MVEPQGVVYEKVFLNFQDTKVLGTSLMACLYFMKSLKQLVNIKTKKTKVEGRKLIRIVYAKMFELYFGKKI